MKPLTEIAEELGFAESGYVEVEQIRFVPEYRVYCEDNICGKFDKVPCCPPACGTPEEMRDKVLAYKHAFVMKTVWHVDDFNDLDAYTEMKSQHNMITRELVKQSEEQGLSGLTITVGPTATSSCISAYCIEVGELAKSCGMECFCGDNKVAFFSMFCYN